MSTRLEPGPDHPISIEPAAGPVTATVDGTVVARTERALTLAESGYPPVQYVPLDDVEPGVLVPTSTSTHCPYKGDARYWSLVVDGAEHTDAVWGYDEPYPAVGQIAGHVAFGPGDVEVAVG